MLDHARPGHFGQRHGRANWQLQAGAALAGRAQRAGRHATLARFTGRILGIDRAGPARLDAE
jgi:hypothetical protein